MRRRYFGRKQGLDANLCISVGGAPCRLQLRHVTIGEVAWHHPSRFEHQHDVYHIEVFTSGKNICYLKGKEVPVRRGKLFLVSPGEPHSFSVTQPEPCTISEFTFAMISTSGKKLRIPFIDLLSSRFSIELKPVSMPHQLSEPMVRSFENLIESILDILLRDPVSIQLELHQAIDRLLGALIRECFLNKDFGSDKATRIESVQRHIEQTCSSDESMESLARKAGLSRAHFQREFKRLTGATPASYRMKLRIEMAKALLSTGRLQCRQIAQHLGFADEYHFSRTFKKMVGCPPSEYRK